VHLILLDGPKGAGKSTVSRALKERLPDAESLSLDAERSAIPGALPNAEFNRQAFASLLHKAEALLARGGSVIVDCGLSKERLEELRALAAQQGASLHAYGLTAPAETLLARVRERDAAKGKVTDEARFHETYAVQQAKGTEGLTIFDTERLRPDDIAGAILSDIGDEPKELRISPR
jgi:predicted kinase